MSAVTLRLTDSETAEHRGLRSERKTITLPTYDVLLDGEKVGVVKRAMVTRETRSKGRRYVNSRWTSPGWVPMNRYWNDQPTRHKVVALALEQAGVDYRAAEVLARAAKVIRP